MPVKMNPTSTIKANLGLEPNGRVQKFFTNTCYKHMDKYVPKDEGNLRTIVDVESNSITYESPYARYQYYGKKMVMSNGKSAFYSKDYGFWSKKGETKTLDGNPNNSKSSIFKLSLLNDLLENDKK